CRRVLCGDLCGKLYHDGFAGRGRRRQGDRPAHKKRRGNPADGVHRRSGEKNHFLWKSEIAFRYAGNLPHGFDSRILGFDRAAARELGSGKANRGQAAIHGRVQRLANTAVSSSAVCATTCLKELSRCTPRTGAARKRSTALLAGERSSG